MSSLPRHESLAAAALPEADPLRETLVRALRTDGPARWRLAGRERSRPVRGYPSPWWTEEPRSRNEPRRIRVTAAGMAWVLDQTAPDHREELARSVSPLYRETFFGVWTTLVRERGETAERQAWERCGRAFAARFRTGDDAEEFRRAVAVELVLSWKHADHPEAKEGIARALRAAGVHPVGVPGEETTFVGRRHRALGPVFPGDPVRVREPGWSLAEADGERLLEKAVVEPVSPT